MKNAFLPLFIFLSFTCKTQTINAYAKITSVTGSSVLALSNVNITNHTFTVGGQVVIMQMQDDVIGSNTSNNATFGNLSAIANAGRYEIRTIAAVSPTSGAPTSMTLAAPLVNTFNTGANSSVQLISFRNMGTNFTTTANIGAPAWNGNVGGVIAFYVTNTLTLNHRIQADGIGFNGGLYSNNNGGPICSSPSNTLYITNNANLGFKGAGIYKNTTANYTNARGRMLNGGGGGNDHNAGGGGGGNYTAGGQGGNGYNNCTSFPGGGLGGLSLSAHISAGRVFMGGGGGGGQQNNSQNSSGGNGGGIILIKANTIQTSTTCGSSILISANGSASTNGGNDGMGGGGAGGSIVIEASVFSINGTCPLLVAANGGDGGDCGNATPHAGGGGGGQGVVIFSSAQPTTNVTTQTNNGLAGQDNSGGSTSAGNGSGTNGSGVISSSSGPLPVTLIDFTGETQQNHVFLQWRTASENNCDYFEVEKSTNGIEYVVISRIKGSGTTHLCTKYSANDYKPEEGKNYYRLKQTDYDGSFVYSSVILLDFSSKLDFIFSPNPVKNGEEISFFLTENAGTYEVNILITNLAGEKILEETINASQDNRMAFVLKNVNLTEGVYFIRMKNGNALKVKKLIVK